MLLGKLLVPFGKARAGKGDYVMLLCCAVSSSKVERHEIQHLLRMFHLPEDVADQVLGSEYNGISVGDEQMYSTMWAFLPSLALSSVAE